MNRKFLYVVLTISALVVFQFIGKGQRKTADLEAYFKSLVYDDQTIPYKLTVNGGAVGFCNETPHQITGYRVGCVKKENDELAILSEEEFQEKELAPKQENGLVSCRMTVSFHDVFPLNQCKEGKLAVIEVRFKDADDWKLKP